MARGLNEDKQLLATIYCCQIKGFIRYSLVRNCSVPLSRHKQKADLLIMSMAVPFIGLHNTILKIVCISMTNYCKGCTSVLQQVIFFL